MARSSATTTTGVKRNGWRGGRLRLAKAKTMEQANAVLARFLPEYNRKFAKAAKETGNDFRKPDQRVNRDRLFRLRYERTVGHDHTISFGAHSIQLPPVAGREWLCRPAGGGEPSTEWRTARLAGRSAPIPGSGAGRVYGWNGPPIDQSYDRKP